MKKQLQQVREFQQTFNFPASDKPTIPNKKRTDLRITLIQEEFDEVVQAIETGAWIMTDKNRQNLAKELADLLYVTLGTMIDFGIDATQENYLPMSNMADPKLVQANIERLQEAIEEKSIHDAYVSLSDLAEFVYDFVERYHFIDEFPRIFDEVHRSNMSKACHTFNEAMDTFNLYEKEKDILCSKIETDNGMYIIQRLSDGKLLKPVNYSPAELGGIIG